MTDCQGWAPQDVARDERGMTYRATIEDVKQTAAPWKRAAAKIDIGHGWWGRKIRNSGQQEDNLPSFGYLAFSRKSALSGGQGGIRRAASGMG
jgi:hypothetical protein